MISPTRVTRVNTHIRYPPGPELQSATACHHYDRGSKDTERKGCTPHCYLHVACCLCLRVLHGDPHWLFPRAPRLRSRRRHCHQRRGVLGAPVIACLRLLHRLDVPTQAQVRGAVGHVRRPVQVEAQAIARAKRHDVGPRKVPRDVCAQHAAPQVEAGGVLRVLAQAVDLRVLGLVLVKPRVETKPIVYANAAQARVSLLPEGCTSAIPISTSPTRNA